MEKHKHGGDIYSGEFLVDYSANINPLGPPERVVQAIEESAARIEHYPDVRQRRLRQELAAYKGVDQESLIFGNGAAELIFALCLGLRPKKALLTVPGFAEYEEALSAADCEISYYKLEESRNYQMGAEYLEKIHSGLDILFLCNPNNPTGTITSREMLLEIANKCREHQVLMVVDECFNGFLDEPEKYSLKGWIRSYPNLFLLNAFTKLYALPGLRLGYGMSADQGLIGKIQRVIQPWNVSLPAQEAGIVALSQQEYVQRSRKLVREEREFLLRQLRTLGLRVWEGAANYLFFQGPEGLAESCRRKGYLIRDCSNYRGLKAGYYRIAIRRPEQNRKFLQELENILSS